jgi:tetratricopeptide (TPR) repeat protein
MLLLLTGRLQRALSPQYWLWRLRTHKLDPVERARLVTAQWLAAQHYIHNPDGEGASLQSAFAEIQGLAWPVPLKLAEAAFLNKVLQANELFCKGEHAQAARLYRELLKEQEPLYRGARRHSNPEERRDLEFRANVLALLWCNLAQALIESGADAVKIDSCFKRAFAYQPMSYLREVQGKEAIRRKAWDEARNAYEEAYWLDSSKERERFRSFRLAQLATEKAGILKDEGDRYGAIDVLENALQEIGENGDKGWIGRIQYLLADLYHAQQRREDAIEACRRGAEAYRQAGDLASESFLQETRGDYLAELRRDAEAIAAYEEGLTSLKTLSDKTEQRGYRRELLLKAGLLQAVAGNADQARRTFAEWSSLARVDLPWNRYPVPVNEATSLLERADVAGALRVYLDTGLREAFVKASVEEGRAMVYGLRGLWSTEIWGESVPETVEKKPEDKPALAARPSEMSPLRIHVHSQSLEGLGSVEEMTQQWTQWVSAARERIQNEYGVVMPGVHLSDQDEKVPPGGYSILIHEVPRASGRLRPDSKWFLGPRETLEAAGIKPRELKEPPPLEGGWVAPDDWPRAEQAGLALLPPLDFLVRHLEEVVTANLVEFVAHQEVRNLLRTHGIVKAEELHKIVSHETASHMDPLTKVVRCLVSERVPVTGFNEIHRVFEARLAMGAPPGKIVEEIRSLPAVRDRLWGNDGRHRLFRIGASLEAELDRAMTRKASPVLVLDRGRKEHLLAAVRVAVQGTPRPGLVVRYQRHRPLARALVSSEYPDLPVLSLRELGPGADRNIAGVVEVEPST